MNAMEKKKVLITSRSFGQISDEPLRVLEESWHMTTGVVKQVWVSFGKLITGQFEMNQLSGPVGVTQMTIPASF